MPYKSKAQAAYFNIHKKKLESEGVDVNEWNEVSKGKKMPEHAPAAAAEPRRRASGGRRKGKKVF